MKPWEIFNVIVKTVGLIILLTGLWKLFEAILPAISVFLHPYPNANWEAFYMAIASAALTIAVGIFLLATDWCVNIAYKQRK